MNKIQQLTILLILFLSNLASSCIAPFGKWGKICAEDIPIRGVMGSYVEYEIHVYSPDIQIECRALGFGILADEVDCRWQDYDIGVFPRAETAKLIWNDAYSSPQIQCRGINGKSEVIFLNKIIQSNNRCKLKEEILDQEGFSM